MTPELALRLMEYRGYAADAAADDALVELPGDDLHELLIAVGPDVRPQARTAPHRLVYLTVVPVPAGEPENPLNAPVWVSPALLSREEVPFGADSAGTCRARTIPWPDRVAGLWIWEGDLDTDHEPAPWRQLTPAELQSLAAWGSP